MNDPVGGRNDTSGTDKGRVCGNFTTVPNRFGSGECFWNKMIFFLQNEVQLDR